MLRAQEIEPEKSTREVVYPEGCQYDRDDLPETFSTTYTRCLSAYGYSKSSTTCLGDKKELLDFKH